MNVLREYFVMFLLLFFIIFIIMFFSKRKIKKNKSIPIIYYLKKVYGIKIDKKSYDRYLFVFVFINTFVIDTSYIIIIYLINNLILRFIFGIIVIILLTIICYGIFARIILMKEGSNDV